ncbi:hypothetical protein LZ31DRAFT_167364 [Colletotrichum somersetense]|nr:hypothetical protein LZ31DRAFT_167364 [Colletotrichum somersetense]
MDRQAQQSVTVETSLTAKDEVPQFASPLIRNDGFAVVAGRMLKIAGRMGKVPLLLARRRIHMEKLLDGAWKCGIGRVVKNALRTIETAQ